MLDGRFEFGMHNSNIIETFYDDNLQPVVVPPNCVIDLATIRSCYRNRFWPVKNYLAEIDKREGGNFYIRRTFALGDVLMLVPVVRYLKILGYTPYVQTSDMFVGLLRMLGLNATRVRNMSNDDEFGISLNGTVERDHRDKVLSRMHRVHIYLKALGVKEMPEEYDWSCNLSMFPERSWGDKPYIVLQSGGSAKMRQLLPGADEYLKNRFKKKGIEVICLGDRMGQQLSKAGLLFTLIAGAQCLVCMDSAPLWVSHFTKTPVVCIFGPSNYEQRLTLHPLYPEGAVPVVLSKEVECEPCYEDGVKCDGRVSCLKVPLERIYDLVEPQVLQFWEA